MSNIRIGNGQIETESIELLELGDSLRVNGTLQGADPAVLSQGFNHTVRVGRSGSIESDGTAIRVEGINTEIINRGLISGDFNGIDIANGDRAFGQILNRGTITSESRAVNIGGFGGLLDNRGLITTSADPRNGTVYGDVTGDNIFIINRRRGVIDVGEGNNGDAISLELGAEVNGRILNTGLVQGRGVADGTTNTASSAVRLYWVEAAGAPVSQFNGNIVNEGELATENGAAVIIDNRVALNGAILNSGLITGGVSDTFSGYLAVDTSNAASPITLVNTGAIRGDVLLSDNNDTYVGLEGTLHGVVFGNGGNDQLLGGESDDALAGGTGDDFILANGGNDFLSGGSGNDFIDAGEGDDQIFGGVGLDFVLTGTGNDGVTLSNQGFTIVGDFNVGGDTLALSGLRLDDISIEGIFNSTVITAETTGEAIAFLPFVNPASLENSFVGADPNPLLGGSAGNGDTVGPGHPQGSVTPMDGLTGTQVPPFGPVNSGTSGNDFLNGTDGRDQINGGDGADIINGLGRRDLLKGELGDDIVHGGDGMDELTGSDGNDVLNGGSGDDLIDGGLGNDALFGGEGMDTFVITPTSGVDIIFDFEPGTDLFSFEAGLGFDQVSLVQSGSHTLILAESGAPLAGLVNTQVEAVEAALNV